MAVTSEIVKSYLKRFPKLPSTTLAKKIATENKQMFTVESARNSIRYYRGALGKAKRRDIKTTDFLQPKKTTTNWLELIPETHSEAPEVWYLPKQYKRVLIISDVHIPYHDVPSIKACFDYALKQKVDCVYINGDMLDFYGLSFHEKDARKRPTIADELHMGREFLKAVKECFNVPIYLKPANHEKRLERYLTLKAPELLDCSEFRLPVLLQLGSLGVNWIDARTKTYFGKLLVEHGDRIKGNGGVNPARTLYLRYKRHTLCGHFHKKSEHTGKVYDGHLINTYSVGSLCELEPEYFEVNEHTNGFAIVEMDGQEFRVRNYTIENGKVF